MYVYMYGGARPKPRKIQKMSSVKRPHQTPHRMCLKHVFDAIVGGTPFWCPADVKTGAEPEKDRLTEGPRKVDR